jgi:BTB/POZ domain
LKDRRPNIDCSQIQCLQLFDRWLT